MRSITSILFAHIKRGMKYPPNSKTYPLITITGHGAAEITL